MVRRHDHRLGKERLIVDDIAPGYRIGRSAAFLEDGRITIYQPDQFSPDLRVVDHEAAITGHVVGLVGGHELNELDLSIVHSRHREPDASDVPALCGLVHRWLHVIAPELPERIPFARDIGEGEARLLE